MLITTLPIVKLLVAYLLGGLVGSLLLARWAGGDIRREGSGNAGGTNALRTRGWRFALAVVLIDIGKGLLAAWLGLQAFGTVASPDTFYMQALGCAFAATLGHVWPPYFGFAGGKGVATLGGALLVLLPLGLPPLLLLWLLVLLGSGYAGLASIAVALALPLVCWWLAPPAPAGVALLWFGVLSGVLLCFTHRGNARRLYAGREHRFERARLLHRLRQS